MLIIWAGVLTLAVAFILLGLHRSPRPATPVLGFLVRVGCDRCGRTGVPLSMEDVWVGGTLREQQLCPSCTHAQEKSLLKEERLDTLTLERVRFLVASTPGCWIYREDETTMAVVNDLINVRWTLVLNDIPEMNEWVFLSTIRTGGPPRGFKALRGAYQDHRPY